MMVGRALDRPEREAGRAARGEVALEVRGSIAGRWCANVSFSVQRGEILGFAGLMGAGRTEVARAVFGADHADSPARSSSRGVPARIRSPVARGRRGHRLSLRGPQALRPRDRDGRRGQRRHGESCRHLSRSASSCASASIARGGREIRQAAQHPHAVGHAGGAAALRRKPAEDRGRQMAGARLRHPVLRRADARHRRRRQEPRSTSCCDRSPIRARRSS